MEPVTVQLGGLVLSVKDHARMDFMVLTVARCVTAEMVPAVTTSQGPATALLAGWEPSVTRHAKGIGTVRTAARSVTVTMGRHVIM